MDIILFATAGRTDLQVLIKDKTDGNIYRTNFESKEGLREVHQALLDKKLSYVIKSSEDYPEHPKEPFVILQKNELSCKNGDFELHKENEQYVLVPEKLRAVVKSIKDSKNKIFSVVVFGTHRNHQSLKNEKFYKNEPIACAPLLAEWLSTELDLKFYKPEDKFYDGVTYINILTKNMMSPDSGRNDPVNRKAIRRVNEAMKSLATTYKDAEAWLSFGGGMPEFKEPIKECARYVFNNRIIYWHTPQFNKDEYVRVEPGGEPASIQESFQCRNNARALILKGDFIGAYAAVEHLNKDEKDKDWVKKIHSAARYFMGNLENEEDAPELKALLRNENMPHNKPPRCLLVAMRCESSLQAKRYSEAVAWTCTFFDAALMDIIENQDWCEELDDLAKTVTVKKECQNKIKEFTEILPNNKYACLNKLRSSHNCYSYMTPGLFKDKWLKLLKVKALESYSDALQKPENNITPSDLRNINMHSILTPSLFNRIAQVFQKTGLWVSNKQAQQLGNIFFLDNDLSKNILKYLGYPDPARLYKEDIVNNLLKELDNYEIQ